MKYQSRIDGVLRHLVSAIANTRTLVWQQLYRLLPENGASKKHITPRNNDCNEVNYS